jgi:RNA-directed DNA polymerase
MFGSPKRLANRLGETQSMLNEVAERIDDDKSYREWSVVKFDDLGFPKLKNGEVQYRHLCESPEPLKIIQKKINKRILSLLPLPPNVKGGVKGSSNIANAAAHRGKNHHFGTDLSNYFPSIWYEVVYEMFIRNGCSADVAHILTRLTTYKGSIPQGAPTSTSIANLVFVPTDLVLLEFCRQHRITYTRYVDDLIFSSGQSFKHLIPEIVGIIRSSGFPINHRKTYYKTGPALITGVIVRNNMLSPKPQQMFRLLDARMTMEERRGLEGYVNQVEARNSPATRKINRARLEPMPPSTASTHQHAR